MSSPFPGMNPYLEIREVATSKVLFKFKHSLI
jgi:hypothetical protein